VTLRFFTVFVFRGLPTRSVVSNMAPVFSLARLGASLDPERLKPARGLTARRHSQGAITTERTALHGAVLFSFQLTVWVGPTASAGS
jgi:hypothetical protein